MDSKQLLTHLDETHLENLNDSSYASSFVSEEKYHLLIIRGLDLKDSGLGFTTKNLIISHDENVYQYSKEKKKIVESEHTLESSIDLIWGLYSKNKSIIEEYVAEIDKLEDSLYDRNTSRAFMDVWFDIKKDLSKMERHFKRNHSVLLEFHKKMSKYKSFDVTESKDLLHEVSVVEHLVAGQITKLDAVYSYFVSIKNDKLNNNIYIMTILSAVFLPLNLIVGFFGMNTENLYFKENPLGTSYVVSIIGIVLALTIFGLPAIRLVDKLLNRIFIGRSDIYKKLSKKLNKLEI